MDYCGYIALVAMGIVLGLIGAGGSIMTIPILVYLFQIPIVIATTYSLVIVGLNACFATLCYRKSIQVRKTINFTLPSLIGVIIGRHYIIHNLPNTILNITLNKALTIFLLILMTLSSFFMIKDFKYDDNRKKQFDYSFMQLFKVALIGLILGIIMSVLGSGGGFLIIPILIIFMNFSIKQAIPTSLFIVTINSLIGFAVDRYSLEKNDWLYLMRYLICAFFGMIIGLYINKSINGIRLKKAFGYFICLIEVAILLKEFIL